MEDVEAEARRRSHSVRGARVVGAVGSSVVLVAAGVVVVAASVVVVV